MSGVEEWVDVPGWEGFYRVSNLGRIEGHNGRLLRPMTRKGRSPYKVVTLSDQRAGRRRQTELHILVCLAFHGPRPEGGCVRHLNGDPQDNSAANLRWGTISENAYDSVRHGTHPTARRTHCPQGHPLDSENTYGHRGCSRCNREVAARYRRRRRQRIAGDADQSPTNVKLTDGAKGRTPTPTEPGHLSLDPREPFEQARMLTTYPQPVTASA